MSATHRRRPEWSELQRYLLGLVLEKLDLVAHARFASVCSSWRSVAVENPPIGKPLHFALSHDPKRLVSRFITSFIPSWDKCWFVGALDGWLVIAVYGQGLFLVNKGFNSVIPLPSPTKDFPQRGGPYKAVLSSPPLSPQSSGECTVFINHSSSDLFYFRLGSDKPFTRVFGISGESGRICDFLFHKGQLYVLCIRAIIIFDRLLNKVSQSLVTRHLAYTIPPWRLLVSGNNNIPYIVAGQPCRYSVFALEGSEPRLVRVNSIGEDDDLVLINRYFSLSIAAKEHKEFRRNTFYFENGSSTYVLDKSKDPNKAKADDPWPLFFVMFSYHGIENLEIYANHNVVW